MLRPPGPPSQGEEHPASRIRDAAEPARRGTRIAQWWRRRVVEPVLALLRQGVTPEKLAWSLALGAVLGLFPVVGTTTLLCTVAAIGLRLNLVAIQISNYAVYPLQIVLLLPFMRGGERLFGADPLPLDPSQLRQLAATEGWRVVLRLGDSGLYAVGAWALASPFLLLGLVALLRPLLRRLPAKH